MVIKVSLGTMVGSLYKWEHIVMSLDAAEFLVALFGVTILRFSGNLLFFIMVPF